MTKPASHEQLEALLNQYSGLIRRVVARVAGSRLQAIHEDIAQQVSIGLWKQCEREQTIEFPSSYVYRAAVREAVRALRQALARQPVALDDVPEPMVRAAGNPEQALSDKQAAGRIVGVLNTLAPDRRRAVRAHLAGFDVNEIMAMYGWPYQKARNLIARGVADLRAKLGDGNG